MPDDMGLALSSVPDLAGRHVFRFSLTAMFGAVLFVAFGVAAIRFTSPLWAGLTMAVTMPLLFAAILGALFRLGQARAFWTGVAVCGWGYLLIVLAPWFESGLGRYLPTSYLLSYIDAHLRVKTVPLPGDTVDGMGRIVARNGMRLLNDPNSGLVRGTGHALFALLFGFIGGVTAKWLYLTRSPREDERPR